MAVYWKILTLHSWVIHNDDICLRTHLGAQSVQIWECMCTTICEYLSLLPAMMFQIRRSSYMNMNAEYACHSSKVRATLLTTFLSPLIFLDYNVDHVSIRYVNHGCKSDEARGWKIWGRMLVWVAGQLVNSVG